MGILFFISTVIILLFTFILQLWGIYCLIIFGKIIRTLDKLFFLMPIFIPVKTIREIIDGADNIQSLIVYLKVVNFYKIVFLVNIIIYIFFVIM